MRNCSFAHLLTRKYFFENFFTKKHEYIQNLKIRNINITKMQNKKRVKKHKNHREMT